MLANVIVFIIVLSILIFIHELGHFIAAKKSGIKVEEFGFGYPPRIWGKKVGGTVYSVNLIPFGGFVRLLGQERREKEKYSPSELRQAFFNKSKKTRSLVLLAGIFNNFLLGVLCFSVIYSKLGIPRKLGAVEIVEVLSGGPAAEAGLQAGEQITAIQGQETVSIAEFTDLIEANQGQEISLQAGEKELTLIPRKNPPPEEGSLGVIITDTELVFYPWWQMPFLGAWEGLKEAFGWSLMVLEGICLSLRQLFAGVVPEVAGPVGIFQLTAGAAEQGLLSLIQFVGILSVNLAVLNLLPLPALDGGHLVFVFVGDLLEEKRREKVEHIINLVGFVFLLSLMVLVTISDLSRLWQGWSLFNLFRRWFS